MSLAEVRSGRVVRILAIRGGRGICGRLGCMGVFPGVEAEVTNARPGGPVVIRVAGSRFVIGCGMASRVIVEPVPGTGESGGSAERG
jgi:Fe2+ transport system protein FeoA